MLLPLAPVATAGGPKAPPAPKEAKNGHSALYDWLMNTYDLDKDGKLDEKERAAVREAFAKKDFMAAKLDVNANGTLENEEIDRVITELEGKKAVKVKSAPKKRK